MLRQEWRARVEAGPALARADYPNHLGSRAVLRGLVDGYFVLLIARAGGRVPFDACAATVHRLARIFADADPALPAISLSLTAGQNASSKISNVRVFIYGCDLVDCSVYVHDRALCPIRHNLWISLQAKPEA